MASGTVKKTIGGFGVPSTVTLPYSPKTDGIVVGSFSPSTASNSWTFVYRNGDSYSRAMSSGGTGYGICFPVKAGENYTHQQGNVANSTYTFFGFV